MLNLPFSLKGNGSDNLLTVNLRGSLITCSRCVGRAYFTLKEAGVCPFIDPFACMLKKGLPPSKLVVIHLKDHKQSYACMGNFSFLSYCVKLINILNKHWFAFFTPNHEVWLEHHVTLISKRLIFFDADLNFSALFSCE